MVLAVGLSRIIREVKKIRSSLREWIPNRPLIAPTPFTPET
jgi:hypothetical protein